MASGRKGRRTADEERKLMSLLTKSYDYLNRNFENFEAETKVHIALELIKKRVPQEMHSESEVTYKVEHVELEERLQQLCPSRN